MKPREVFSISRGTLVYCFLQGKEIDQWFRKKNFAS